MRFILVFFICLVLYSPSLFALEVYADSEQLTASEVLKKDAF